ncbi:hypothetical protein HWV62_44175 [Athelia sp. TMB]|nr:hypothetical protein HWV62_44175 [Athelia sp. TMB]
MQRSEFSGPPSPAVDKAWKDLYHRYVISAIPEEQAVHLSNETMRVPGPGHPRYIVGLDVFHQLHCLDYIRYALYPEYYGPQDHTGIIAPPGGPDEEPFDHLDHCLNNVRSALMCNADLTPVVTQWDAGTHRNWVRLDVVHTCKDWDAVHQWAVDAHIGARLNMSEHVGFPEDN